MMEAIERCLDHLDEPTMIVLLPSIEEAMRNALGLPSKVSNQFSHVSMLSHLDEQYLWVHRLNRILGGLQSCTRLTVNTPQLPVPSVRGSFLEPRSKIGA